MQNHREVVCVAQVGDFFRGGDAADPIDIELNDIDRLGPAFGTTRNGQPWSTSGAQNADPRAGFFYYALAYGWLAGELVRQITKPAA